MTIAFYARRCFQFLFLKEICLGAGGLNVRASALDLNQKGVVPFNVVESSEDAVELLGTLVFFRKFFLELKSTILVAQI